MNSAKTPSNDDGLGEVKRLATIKLEADLHAFLDALTAVGVGEEEAVNLARATVRSALTRRREG